MNFTDLRVIKTHERFQNALLALLEAKELKAITVKEICDKAGISRNTFYQHYGYKEDLYGQMVAIATQKIRDALEPVVADASHVGRDSIEAYARRVIGGVSEVKDLLRVMLRRDDGKLLRQLADLIFEQNIRNAMSFFGVEDSAELRLYYEYSSAGMAAFITRWILAESLTEGEAVALLAQILLQPPAGIPQSLRN